MMMRGRVTAILRLSAILTGLSVGAAVSQEIPLSPIEGVWRAEPQSEITIAPCELGFCGYLSKIVVPEDILSAEEAEAAAKMSPEQFFDKRNEDPALRNRPMLGLHMLTLRPGERPTVFDGEVYNPQDGKTYSGYVELLGPDALRLNGCVLYNVICRGEDWVRVPQGELDARAAAEAQ
ncbi:DUF2147 domain-containing protein [Devosia sp. Leaf64]|jgi:uncharacterized protein (DUF2147 family)|uniref:DUF2147 domain-containing protein n=1 Tax=Devosia sp. Leaf64 TaxID=1736229 RepID=UPI000715DF01|nr:DUF2147 domain-containing protein [Devosia sp. Leaf64]KQN72473.1 hypothetical protein ASE94_08160 [Devosia sp. Leaf64]